MSTPRCDVAIKAEFTYPNEALRFIRVNCHSCLLQAGVGLTHSVYYRCGGSRGIEPLLLSIVPPHFPFTLTRPNTFSRQAPETEACKIATPPSNVNELLAVISLPGIVNQFTQV